VGELGSLAGSNRDKKKEGETERRKERDRAGGREGKKERRESERGKGLRKISCGNDRRRGEGELPLWNAVGRFVTITQRPARS